MSDFPAFASKAGKIQIVKAKIVAARNNGDANEVKRLKTVLKELEQS